MANFVFLTFLMLFGSSILPLWIFLCDESLCYSIFSHFWTVLASIFFNDKCKLNCMKMTRVLQFFPIFGPILGSICFILTSITALYLFNCVQMFRFTIHRHYTKFQLNRKKIAKVILRFFIFGPILAVFWPVGPKRTICAPWRVNGL